MPEFNVGGSMFWQQGQCFSTSSLAGVQRSKFEARPSWVSAGGEASMGSWLLLKQDGDSYFQLPYVMDRVVGNQMNQMWL